MRLVDQIFVCLGIQICFPQFLVSIQSCLVVFGICVCISWLAVFHFEASQYFVSKFSLRHSDGIVLSDCDSPSPACAGSSSTTSAGYSKPMDSFPASQAVQVEQAVVAPSRAAPWR